VVNAQHHVTLKQQAGARDALPEARLRGLRQNCYAILAALAVADKNFPAPKVNVKYAKTQTLIETQPAAIHH
jgi:hypothetical protein